MLCKKCGKELPDYGQFCPFCGAPMDLDPNGETAPFPTVPEDGSPIDTAAFDAAREQDEAERTQVFRPVQEQTQIYSAPRTPEPPAAPPQSRRPAPRTPEPSVAPQAGSRPERRTTYYAQPDPDDTPYRKSGAGKKVGIVVLIVVLLIGIGVGGYFFIRSRQPDENLTAAQKYMQKGKFEDALTAFQAALADAKDPADIQMQINLLTDYQSAQQYVEQGEYAQAIALLRSISDRIADPNSALADAVDKLIADAEAKQSDASFSSDMDTATQYLADKKFDQCAAILDSLESDSKLTGDQQRQISKLRDELTTAQQAEQRQQETQKQQEEKKSSFSSQISDLETFDEQLSNAPTTEEMLQVTSSSFEGWDSLLTDMYSYLETSLSADDYAAAEQDYENWVKTRDEAAQNAALGVSDPTEAQLASMSIQQSYTKSRCYKLLDMM